MDEEVDSGITNPVVALFFPMRPMEVCKHNIRVKILPHWYFNLWQPRNYWLHSSHESFHLQQQNIELLLHMKTHDYILLVGINNIDVGAVYTNWLNAYGD